MTNGRKTRCKKKLPSTSLLSPFHHVHLSLKFSSQRWSLHSDEKNLEVLELLNDEKRRNKEVTKEKKLKLRFVLCV